MKRAFTIGLAIVLVACTQKSIPVSDEQQVVPFAQSSSSNSSLASSVTNGSEGTGHSLQWKEYTDTSLGVAFKYPVQVGDGANFNCNNQPIPLKIFHHDERVILAQEYYLTSDCASPVKPTNAEILSQPLPSLPFDKSGRPIEGFYNERSAGSLLNIWMKKVKDRKQLLDFLHQIYGSACRFDQESEQKVSSTKTRLFLTTDSTSIEDGFACADKSILFNPQTGVVVTFFMPLKTAVSFSTPDHKDNFDSEIDRSFRFLQ